MNWQELRIGVIGPLPPPAGGMASLTRQLFELLETEGATVEIVQSNAAYRPRWIGSIRGVRALFRLVPYLHALWRCTGRVDVLHVMANSGWSWHLAAAPAIWVGKLRGVRVVVNFHGGAAEPFLRKAARRVRISLTQADLLVVPSGFLQDVFARFGVQAELLPNFVDLSRFHPGTRTPAHNGQFRILVARNLERIYDIAAAIRAFALVRKAVPGARMIIAGSGPMRAELERLASDLGVAASLEFAGRLGRDEMAAAYGRADALLNTSLVDNAPVSLLEALASGVPIVSTNVGGIPYIVENEVTALLIPPGDHVAMAGALCQLRNDRALAERLRASGLASIQRYARSNVRVALLAMYTGAMAPAATHARPV